MKKALPILLALPLIVAIGFLSFAYATGSMPDWLVTPGPSLMNTTVVTIATPTRDTAAAPSPASTITPAKTATKTLSPSKTPAKTIASTPASTATATLENTPAVIATETPARDETDGGIVQGDVIIQAIEAYHLDQGIYPLSLNDLVPQYLPVIPVTLTGQAYFYRFFDAADPMADEMYWLAFRVTDQEHVTCTYLRRLEYWDCNYASP